MEKFLPGSAASESLAYFNYNISNILPFYIAHHYLFVLSFTLIYSPFYSRTKFIYRKGLGSKSLKCCACIMRSTLGGVDGRHLQSSCSQRATQNRQRRRIRKGAFHLVGFQLKVVLSCDGPLHKAGTLQAPTCRSLIIFSQLGTLKESRDAASSRKFAIFLTSLRDRTRPRPSCVTCLKYHKYRNAGGLQSIGNAVALLDLPHVLGASLVLCVPVFMTHEIGYIVLSAEAEGSM